MTTESWHYSNPPQRDGQSCSHSWIYHYKKRPVVWHPPSGPAERSNRRFAQRKICSKCGLRMQRIGDAEALGKTVQWEERGYAGYAPCERAHFDGRVESFRDLHQFIENDEVKSLIGKTVRLNTDRTLNFAPMYGHDLLQRIPLDEVPCTACGNRLGHPFSDCPPRIRRLRNILIF
jgi:hypothetical protein